MFVLLYNFSKILITYCIISCSFLNVAISQDLTRQEPIEKIIYFKGELGQHHYYEPSELTFHTGKLYRLILSNKSDSKHYFSSSLFARAIFTRKIQINYNSKKVAEVKGIINEVEVWPNHQIEWWFVPVKTGVFEDLFCKVEDEESNLQHSDMGMRGTIIIK